MPRSVTSIDELPGKLQSTPLDISFLLVTLIYARGALCDGQLDGDKGLM